MLVEHLGERPTVHESASVAPTAVVCGDVEVGAETRVLFDVFIATGATVFNGARIEGPSEVRVNGVVHVASTVSSGTTVPIGWVAVGDPAQTFPPDQHDEIWEVQREMDFPGRVFGVERAAPGETRMPEITRRYSDALRRYAAATTVDG